jgi:hypothetical protein
MPITVDPNPHSRSTSLSNVDHQYPYPDGLDLKPGSKLHETIKRRVLDRAQESWSVMQNRHGEWDAVDATLTAFMPIDEKERIVKAKDSRRPVSIVVPLSYAVKETLLSHLLAIFTQDILWQFDPRGPEDVLGVALMESLIDAQSKHFRHTLALHTFFQDGISKGIGVVAPVWETKYGLRNQMVMDPFTGMPIQNKEEFIRAEGNRLRNINPRLYLPDPNVPAHEVQDAEFVSWVWRDNLIGLLEEEHHSPGTMFNVKYLKSLTDCRSKIFNDANRDNQPSQQNTKPVDRIYMYDKVIPNELGLGPSDVPEIWLFQLAGDEVVIGAQPLGLDHNMFPVAVCAPDFDGYGPTPIGRLEVTLGLQGVADFLYNSHIANVRKSLNDMLVVDPSVININDLTRPGAGKIIRVRRPMFGQGALDRGIKAIPVASVTGGHVNEVGVVDGIMSKVSGASESLQGVFAGGERKSAQESRDTFMSGVGRIEKMARVISEQAMGDLGYMMAMHTQQFLSQESYVGLIGRSGDSIRRILNLNPMEDRVPVGPQDIINVGFDAIIRDGSMPSSSFVRENIELLQLAISDPRTYETYDTARWMAEIARRMGVKNIEDFRLDVHVQPDAQVMEQAGAGNLEGLYPGAI